jgi:transcriptional antiterminator NusG
LTLNTGVSTDRTGGTEPPVAPWHVLWTHSHCEQTVHDQALAKGFHPFLPKLPGWSRRAGLPHAVERPLFPGYLFLNDTLDRTAHVELRKTRGLAAILGERWDTPARVPASEVEALRRVVGCGATFAPHLYLREGQRVRIVGGPLEGVEALLVRHRPHKGLVIVSVHLLQRSVSVELNLSDVVAA